MPTFRPPASTTAAGPAPKTARHSVYPTNLNLGASVFFNGLLQLTPLALIGFDFLPHISDPGPAADAQGSDDEGAAQEIKAIAGIDLLTLSVGHRKAFPNAATEQSAKEGTRKPRRILPIVRQA
jgi:hypothetical protein